MGAMDSKAPDPGAIDVRPRPATTPDPASPPTAPRRSRRWGCIVVPLALILAGGAWYYPRAKAQADLGTAFAARVACSCRHVAGRSLDSCRADLPPGTEIVMLSEEPEARRVIAAVPLLASASARFNGASGCQIEE